MKKYYQDEEYDDCPNCSFDESYREFMDNSRSEDPSSWGSMRNPCYARRIHGYRPCFKAHPIPWQELIDDIPE